MRRRAVAIAAVLGVLAPLALPGVAIAKPGHYKTGGLSTEQFQLRASDGYRLNVAVVDRRAQLIFSKAISHGGIDVVYSVRRRFPPGPDLHFPIGDEGEVNLRFVPRGKPEETTLPGCKGGPQVVREGALVGTVRFHGKEGFTAVDAHRARVTVARVPPMTCRKVKTPKNVFGVGLPATGGEEPDGLVRLIAGSRPGRPVFVADVLKEGGIEEPELPELSASISGREGGADVTASVLVAGIPSSFRDPGSLQPPATSTVEPPAPFSGSATFALTAPRQAEWNGDLVVELPGYGMVGLTGPGVAAALCEGETCTPTLPKALRPLTKAAKKGFKVSYFNEGEAAS